MDLRIAIQGTKTEPQEYHDLEDWLRSAHLPGLRLERQVERVEPGHLGEVEILIAAMGATTTAVDIILCIREYLHQRRERLHSHHGIHEDVVVVVTETATGKTTKVSVNTTEDA